MKSRHHGVVRIASCDFMEIFSRQRIQTKVDLIDAQLF